MLGDIIFPSENITYIKEKTKKAYYDSQDSKAILHALTCSLILLQTSENASYGKHCKSQNLIGLENYSHSSSISQVITYAGRWPRDVLGYRNDQSQAFGNADQQSHASPRDSLMTSFCLSGARDIQPDGIL